MSDNTENKDWGPKKSDSKAYNKDLHELNKLYGRALKKKAYNKKFLYMLERYDCFLFNHKYVVDDMLLKGKESAYYKHYFCKLNFDETMRVLKKCSDEYPALMDARLKQIEADRAEKEAKLAEERAEKERKEAEIEADKQYARQNGKIYCDFSMLREVINSISTTCPICGSKIEEPDGYVAEVCDTFKKQVGYAAGFGGEATPQFVYEKMVKKFPAYCKRCPQCEYKIFNATYEYYEKDEVTEEGVVDKDGDWHNKFDRLYFAFNGEPDEYDTKVIETRWEKESKDITAFDEGKLYIKDPSAIGVAISYTDTLVDASTFKPKEEPKKEIVKPQVVVNNLSPADEISKFYDLKQKGIITEEEFEAKKRELLGK